MNGPACAVRAVDVSRPLEGLADVAEYPRVRVFVFHGDEPIGSVDIANAYRPVSAARLRDAIADELAVSIARHAFARGLDAHAGRSGATEGSSVAIVLPTCGDRPDELRRCLSSLAQQQTRHHVTTIVVHNRPDSGGVREITRDFPDVTVVEERRPGLSYARNRGIASAEAEIIVCIDDDVVAPARWLERLVAPLVRDDVAAVTGLVLPIELETEAQWLFEEYGGLGRGFERREANRAWFDLFRAAVPTWQLGATANAAFRASLFSDPEVGTLDEALGAGTPTGCSEDTDLFYRILRRGQTIVYEPSAWVWHRHRRTMPELRNQLFAYSKGHVAYQLTTLQRYGDTRALVRLAWSMPRHYVRRALDRIAGRSRYPIRLIALEIAGNLAGPLALWRSRRRVRRLAKRESVIGSRQSAVSRARSIRRGPESAG